MRTDVPDIWVVGLGIRPVDQVTRETERVLRRCNEVLHVDTGVATELWLKTLGPVVTPLREASYVEGQSRRLAYRTIAARVIEAALREPPVALAFEGHPVVGVHPTALIRHAASALELRVVCLAGISSLDSLFATLGFDPFLAGLQAFEATDLVLRRRPLIPDVPTILWQVGNFGNARYTSKRADPEHLMPLLHHLLQFYPSDHPAILFHAAPHAVMDDQIVHLVLRELLEQADQIHPGHTLFLPPTHVRPVADSDLAARLADLT